MNDIRLDVVSDVVCPSCWLGKRRLDVIVNLRQRHDAADARQAVRCLEPGYAAAGRGQADRRGGVGAVRGDLCQSIGYVVDIHHVHAWSISEERPMVTLHADIELRWPGAQ